MTRPRDPLNPPWFCEWQDIEDEPDIGPGPYYRGIVLMWVSDHPPQVGDIVARHGRRMLVVTGPRREEPKSAA